MSKKGRPAGPAKILFRKRLTPAELQAVQAVLAGSLQVVHGPTPGDPAQDAEKVVQTLHSMEENKRRELTVRLTLSELRSLKDLALLRQCFESAALLGDAIKLREVELKLQAGAGSIRAAAELQRVAELQESLPPLPVDALGQKISTASPSGDVHGMGLGDVGQIAHWQEQARLQGVRADDLQTQVDELQHQLDRKEVEIEQLMQTGGTERQSAYIARLLAKITALGGNRNEFDQEGR